MWNAWKGKLLEDLFRHTRRVLRGETGYATSWIAAKKQEALRIFRQYVPQPGKEAALWSRLDDNYFQRFEGSETGWHTRTLWSRVTPDKPIVRARLSPVGEGLQVLVYAPDQPGLFARITSFFERMQLDVAAAKIYTTMHGFALDSFQVLWRSRGTGDHYRDLIQKVETGLAARIAPGVALDPAPSGRVSRWVRHFPIEPVVSIVAGRKADHWLVNVSCADRPGLLSSVARTFLEHGLNLVAARVTTLGARAEDVFVVTGAELADEARRERIMQDLCKLAG